MDDNTKSFAAAADRDMDKILAVIREPGKDPLTAYYIAQRSKEVADGLLQLARTGDAEAVTSFIASDAVRFDTLAGNGQLKTLMETLGQLSTSQQFKVLSATESYLSGAPDATVLKKIVFSKDEKIIEQLGGILHSFDNRQRTDLFSAPMAAWWMSNDHTPLMVEILSPLSQKERQSIVDRVRIGDIASVLEVSCSSELNAVFKDCKFPKPRAAVPEV
jgi:hypothetical protein